MVDTIGVEILRHLTEATYPPLAAVFQHLIPVVGGEAPVLSVSRERIGRSSRLTIQVEILRFNPGFHTITTDANGNVTLQDDTMFTGIVVGSTHLLVEIVLHITPEVGHLLVRLSQRLGPFREGCRTIEITVVAELSIRFQPLLVVLVELFVSRGSFCGRSLLPVKFLQIVHLGIEHAFIVNLGQGIQLLAQLFKMCFSFFIFDFR